MREMDGDELDRNSLRTANRLSCRLGTGESPSRSSITSKGTDRDQFAVRSIGASRRTRRADTPTDLSAFMNSQFFFREDRGDIVSGIVPGSNTFTSEEDDKRGRMLEWLRNVEMETSSYDSSLEGSSNRRPPYRHVANVAPKLLPRPRTPGSSGPLNTRSSPAKSLHSDQFTVQRHSPSAICKLPCQSCGNPHGSIPPAERVSPSPQSNGETARTPAGLYKRADRLSKSARHPEMAVDVIPAVVGTKKTPSPAVQPPVAMYPKFDRFSKSARHPEMAAIVVLAGELNKGTNDNSDSGRSVRHTRSASGGISKSDNRAGKLGDNDTISFDSNRNRKENMPRMLQSTSTRVQRGTIKSKHGSNNSSPSPSYNDSEIKSPAAAVQQWFSQLLRKGLKTEPKVDPVKAGKPPRQPNKKDGRSTRKPSKIYGDRSVGVSYNSSSMELEPEQLMIGATLSDVLNTKGMIITESKVISKSSAKNDQRSSKSNDNNNGSFPTTHLHRTSNSVYSVGLFHSSPVQERTSVAPTPDRSSLNSKSSKQQPTGNDGLLSPPKRRKEAANRLEMLVKDNDRNSRSAKSSPQKLRQLSEADLTGEKLEESEFKRYEVEELNEFLRMQRRSITESSSNLQVMIILSGQCSSSLSSMVSTICYAWILENTTPRSPDGWIPVPVINTSRRNMLKNEQAAWLFHHCGLDTKALLFSDEVDTQNLAHTRHCKTIMVGGDILNTKNEVASCCTLLVEKHSEDAQSMLKGGIMKKLLLAGLLLDTENLDFSSVFCTARDEAVAALLLNGAGSNGRYGFYLQLKRQYYDRGFRSVLRETYGEFADRNTSEAIPQEGNSEHYGEQKLQKPAKACLEKPMVVRKEIRHGLSAPSRTTHASDSITTITIDTTSSIRPSLTSSKSSDTTALQHEVASPSPGGKLAEAAEANATSGGWKGMSRFFTGLGRSRNAVGAERS